MAFSHRMAALAAVVAIPLGIAATSYALTDSPEPPKAPPKLELESGSPTPSGSGSGSPKPEPTPTPSDEVVSRPPVSDGPTGGDDDGADGPDESADDTDDRSERGAGDRDDG
ncbi:small secreted hydrophilic protein [Streptomyces sp. B-S-A8]|uniref:Small secreted hydrophilic protein n=1 Tax=Streptomyces solicavernae TaxID=3043614 RepID=A0ABT6RRW5_9ACTN|nr:small secreted hydrophilic protein [Streptomyces sp. B-S-A8]MDI3387177.1 small secreted hydrophilic protein [Streptomyces sp. B-S-A8]